MNHEKTVFLRVENPQFSIEGSAHTRSLKSENH